MTIYAWFIWAVIIAVILIVVGIWFVRAFYRRSSKEIAFVRTGLGGRRSSSMAPPSLFRFFTMSRKSISAPCACR